MDNFFRCKFISSLEKCFLDDDYDSKPVLESASMLKNERYSLCIAYLKSDEGKFSKETITASVTSSIAADIVVYKVGSVPVELAVDKMSCDDNYIRYTPGLYPDLLTEIDDETSLFIAPNYLNALWVTIEPNEDTCAGDFSIDITFRDTQNDMIVRQSMPIKIIDAMLPEQNFTVTQWLYTDCLANYYNVEAFSDRHFEICENFIKTAVKYGINQILTPVLTPPLDTKEGTERLTTQLVGITVDGEKYGFEFTLLDRWIDICERQNVKIYEISHLFTQWGAKHAPKVMATVNGSYKRIFGWETDAESEDYVKFLQGFLSAITSHMRARGIARERVVFHISDEPSLDNLPKYKKVKEQIADAIEGYEVYDAISNYEFYKQGVMKHPIPANNEMEDFIEHNVPDLWTYYCCGQNVDVSNRFMAMSSTRNRVIVTGFYKYNIVGFLQWGYNFYNNLLSTKAIDPYRITDGEYFAPAGDAFSVYPAADGTAALSLRLVVFYDALQDLRALKLCESLYSREYVMNLLEGDLDYEITFKKYPHDAEYLLNLRAKVNAAIAEAKN